VITVLENSRAVRDLVARSATTKHVDRHHRPGAGAGPLTAGGISLPPSSTLLATHRRSGPYGRIVRFIGCELTSGYTFRGGKRREFWDVLIIPEESSR